MLTKEDKAKVIADNRINPSDTGSTIVQIGLLTAAIKDLTGHCTKFAKDFSTRRGLVQKVSDRKKHLKYLARKVSVQEYNQVLDKFGLRK
jgi:small subunit ribosomal protein S15